jgi:glyoxylase-like metal-dependent hydrolase (beta-lactamase superfamily II)
MRITSLKSGSKGNSTLVMSSKFNLLIDTGGSAKDLDFLLMKSEGLGFEEIDYILITHSHT